VQRLQGTEHFKSVNIETHGQECPCHTITSAGEGSHAPEEGCSSEGKKRSRTFWRGAKQKRRKSPGHCGSTNLCCCGNHAQGRLIPAELGNLRFPGTAKARKPDPSRSSEKKQCLGRSRGLDSFDGR
jgi:hypothetical protein